MAIHGSGERDAIVGVGLRDWGADPLKRAQRMRSLGGAVLVFSMLALVLCFIAATFGLAPIAVPVMIVFIGTAFLGSWMRERGALRLRRMRVDEARREGRPAGA